MKPHIGRVFGFVAVLAAPVLAPAQEGTAYADPESSAARTIPLLSAEQLDEILGPIALYPDALIALILPAATMPTHVVLASRYLGAGGDASKVDEQPWDESVRALAHYPDVIKWMDDKLSWAIMVGDAFVAQPVDVMQSIQRLRARARAAGTLVDSPEQRVVEEKAAIRIVPARPEVIYVPYYDPQVVYVPRPSWVWSAPVITYRWCYPTGVWLSYDCDWYSRRVWCVNTHWRHDWYYSRAWYRPHPCPPSHYYDRHDYGHGWSPRRGRRGGSPPVVIHDGHREYPHSPGSDSHRSRPDEDRGRGDRGHDGDYADGRSGGGAPGNGRGDRPGGSRGDRAPDAPRVDAPPPAPVVRNTEPGRGPAPGTGRWIDRARPRNAPTVRSETPAVRSETPRVVSPPPEPRVDAPRNPPVVRTVEPRRDPAPGTGRWIDRARPGNTPIVRSETPAVSSETPRVVSPPREPRVDAPRNPPAVRTVEPRRDPAPGAGRWIDRANRPVNTPIVRAETPAVRSEVRHSRPAPTTPQVAPPPPAPRSENRASSPRPNRNRSGGGEAGSAGPVRSEEP